MDQLAYLTCFVMIAPLFAALVVGILNKRLPPAIVNWFASICVGASFCAACFILQGFIRGSYTALDQNIYLWGQSGTLNVPIGILIDKLSALMITVVTFVSLMVHIYSIGYMRGDPGYQRFFCYISLFTFSMLLLVLANNFAQIFFGWEAVGLLSYLLIGFWYKRQSANFAGLKAFLINRVGDVGFILGIAAVLYYFDTLQYQEVFAQAPTFSLSNVQINLFADYKLSAVTFMCISLFIGAMAKSAQVPLHVWLPDSMEGPTPISALIHAATMVTAGIFMVVRMSPLFEHSETVLTLMLVIGSITCLSMAILAVVQSDIKRIVAYSTLSQLGYMVIALGASAYSAAMFHLVTHAFFKALLFLGAGSAIIAMHHDQYIFNMGNLRKYMPITTVTMLIGSLALVGFPGTSGFYSKDLIIATTKLSSLPFAYTAYQVSLITIAITALYTFRLFFVAFWDNKRAKALVMEDVHESPRVVWMPLVILAIPSLLAGILLINPILHDFFARAIFVLPEHDVVTRFANNEYHGWLMMFVHGLISLPCVYMVLGIVLAWICYIKYPSLPTILERDLPPVVNLLRNKYGFDALNEKVIVPTTKYMGRVFWRGGDAVLIDGYMVNGTARGVARVAGILRHLQTGYLYHYVFMIVTGLVAVIIWIMYL